VIHRGVDAIRFDPAVVSNARVARLREQWGARGDQRIVLQAARLTSWKGQEVTIGAAALLAQAAEGTTALFVLAGDAQGRDDYRAQLLRQAEAQGVAGLVRLVGHVEDMPAAFACAHVAVIASIEPEAFGRTAVEAQAMACPVIATSIGAPPETVLAAPAVNAGMTTGWLVPPGDARALADCISAALHLGAEERGALGVRARSHALASFSLETMKRQTLAVYDRLLGSGLTTGSPAERPALDRA
jgi:glycosyltransferase involved in cell wall biosynthesis